MLHINRKAVLFVFKLNQILYYRRHKPILYESRTRISSPLILPKKKKKNNRLLLYIKIFIPTLEFKYITILPVYLVICSDVIRCCSPCADFMTVTNAVGYAIFARRHNRTNYEIMYIKNNRSYL